MEKTSVRGTEKESAESKLFIPSAVTASSSESEKHRNRSVITTQIQAYSSHYRELMSYYRCAMMEVETKFKVLNEELSLEYDRNPIEAIKTRLKSFGSIADKLEAYGIPFSVDNIEAHLNDVAGVRVICGFPADIYSLSEAFLRQDDITLIKMKDYLKNPKDNGYRSLHLIVEIPIFLHDEKRLMKVEVQFRTIMMDWWASLEHKIRYKKDLEIPESISKELFECAKAAAFLDNRMEQIQKAIEAANENAKLKENENEKLEEKNP